jgi:perosamine synthetase
VALRRARATDVDLTFAWRNRPDIIRFGLSGRSVDWDEHRQWFAETLREHERLLLVVEAEGGQIGQVRFDWEDDYTCEVSIYLLPEWTGRGLGVVALRNACAEALTVRKTTRIFARIKHDNLASLSAFRRAGFTPVIDAAEMPTDVVLLDLRLNSVVPHNRLTHGTAESYAAAAAVASGQWAIGPRVRELERRLAERANRRHAVCVASGLAAVRLSLRALGVAATERVIVPAYSCAALATAVLANQAEPVPVEIAPGDYNLDPRAAAAVVRDTSAAAIVAVHTFGAPARIAELAPLAPVVEDCAHAFGLDVQGGQLGGFGAVAVLSFHATKLIGAGEGGAVLTDDDAIAEAVRSWRDYTDAPPDATRLNDKPSDLMAAIALAQLDRLDNMLAARLERAERYHELLSGSVSEQLELPDPSRERVWYRYVVRTQLPAGEVIRRMAARRVLAAEPVCDWRRGGAPATPVADHAYRRVVSLPLYPTLSDEEQDSVVRALVEALDD